MMTTTVSDAIYIRDTDDPSGNLRVYPFSQKETDLWYDRSDILIEWNGQSFPLVPKTFLGEPYTLDLMAMAKEMFGVE